jgi:hypothetical protein
MPISDVYTARVAYTGTAVTTAVPALSVLGLATKRSWVTGVRVDITATTAAAGSEVTFTLARSTASSTATSLTSLNAHDFSAPASITQQSTTYSTAPTVGTVLWEQALPLTTGSSWEEFPPSGYEWGVPAIATGAANAGVHMFITQSVATSGYTYLVDLVVSE